MSTLSTFNGIVNNEEGGVCCTLTREAILSLRSASRELDQCTQSHIASLGLVRPRRRCRGGRLKVKLNQNLEIPVRISNRCKQYSAVSTQSDRQRVLRPINRRIVSPVKVGTFNASSVTTAGKSSCISTCIAERQLTAVGPVETWHDGADSPALDACTTSIPVVNGRPPRRQQRRRHQRSSSVLIDCLKNTSTVPASDFDAKIPTLYLLNSASLAKKHAKDQLAADLIGYHVDVAIITETHFKPSKHPDSIMNIDGYNLFRRDRCKRRGGGVAIIRSSISASEVQMPGDDPLYELLWLKVHIAGRGSIFGALYNPPKPLYHQADFLQYLETTIDHINTTSDDCIIIAGDFNTLSEQQFAVRTGLSPIVREPTRGANCLDRVFVSEPLYNNVKVVCSTIKSDHKAVIAWGGCGKITDLHKTRCQREYRTRTPDQHAALLSFLSSLSWGMVYQQTDVQTAFNTFYDTALIILNCFYPQHTITVTSRDPHFVTPRIKALLRKRNRLMRKGAIAAAESITARIGRSIASHNRASFTQLPRGSSQMWSLVRKVTGKEKRRRDTCKDVTVEQLNQHFANISTDLHYRSPQIKSTARYPLQLFTEYNVFRMLDTLKPTAMGLDGLPDWFIRLAAPAFAEPLTYLFNLSLECSVVPTQWKSSYITPIPKIPQPLTCQDYRPISITPILSRIMEKSIVRSLLYPVLISPDHSQLFADQFGFRPTGSTTAALIYLLHQVTNLLQEHEYVHIISLDFSKAFDSVRHHSLISKFSKLPIPDCFYNWAVDYLQSRQHQTVAGEQKSAFLGINASIIQGSGLGPVFYTINASDLHPAYSSNILFKYADDTYLIVPAKYSNLIPEELHNISTWANANNLKLNSAKCCEMVVCHPTADRLKVGLPPPRLDVTRVETITVLGVTFNSMLSFAPHVQNVASKAAASLYALRMLKAHGLEGQALCEVTQSTLVAQLIYASSSWSGFVKAEERAKLQSILNKASRYGFLPGYFRTIDQLFESSDDTLFNSVINNPDHVLCSLLPPPKDTSYNMRKRKHDLTLPTEHSSLQRKNFVYRMLFTDIY